MKGVSIRRRLLAGVAVVQVLAAVLVTVLVVRHERARAYAMLEAELVEHAAMVTSVIEAPDSPTEHAVLHRELLKLPMRDVYVLSDATGSVIAASGSWRPGTGLPTAARSFVDLRIDDKRYHVLIEQGISMFDDDPVERARLPKLTLAYGARTGGVDEHVRELAWSAVGLGLAILAASLLATAWVVRVGLRPVTQLADSAAKIDATHWDWDATGAESEAEELAPLSTALTRLVERLREAFVRERQFSADAAHEMKTAVAIVKSTLELTLERGGGAADYRAGIERAFDDTQRMQELVIGMLQLAKAEGLATEDSGSVDAMQETDTVVRRLGPVLEERKIRVEVDAARTEARVRISAEALGLVLTNLLENAIHYSAEGGVICVGLAERGDAYAISIQDSGCGIDAEVLPHIFERFYRGDASRSRESGGAGLGLAIVQAIVRQSGGTVVAASTPGAGSVFTVTLPREKDE